MDPRDPLGVDPLLEARERWDRELAETRRRWDALYPDGTPDPAPRPAQRAPEPVTQPTPTIPPRAGWCEDRRPGRGVTDHDEVD